MLDRFLNSLWRRLCLLCAHLILPLGLLMTGIGVQSCASLRAPVQPSGNSLRVLTYNLDKDSADHRDALRVIGEAKPDVIFFQEASASWQATLRWNLAGQYPYVSFNSPKSGYDGMGVMSRFPISDETWLPIANGGWFPAQLVTVKAPVGEVQLLNVHLRPPSSDSGNRVVGYLTTGSVRRHEIAGLADHLKPGVATLVVGDFNEGDDGGAVSWLKKRGFIDALRQFDRKASTWQGGYMGLHLSERADHVMYCGNLACYEAKVIAEKASDHDPVLAVFGSK